MPARAKQGGAVPFRWESVRQLQGVPEFAGAPRRNRLRLTPRNLYPDPPETFPGSLAEWVVMWWLREGRVTVGQPKLRLVGQDSPPIRGETFFYQVSPPVVGLFSRTEATRIDFLLPGFGQAGYDSLAIDPYNEYTHRDVGLDQAKRAALAVQLNIQLIWLHTASLEAGDFEIIEDALRGADSSPRALTGR